MSEPLVKETRPKAVRTNALSELSRRVLWARAVGRCQYPGCNKSLIGDLISGVVSSLSSRGTDEPVAEIVPNTQPIHSAFGLVIGWYPDSVTSQLPLDSTRLASASCDRGRIPAH